MKTYNQYILEATTTANRQVFIKLFDKYAKQIVGKTVPVKKILTIVRKIFKPFNVDVSLNSSNVIDKNTLNLNAFYNSVDDEIELELYTHPKEKVFTWDSVYWTYVANLLSDAVVHEIVHQSQYYSRDFEDQRKLSKKEYKSAKSYDIVKKGNKDYSLEDYIHDVEYYANPDELEAFSMNAASELMISFGNKDKVLKVLKKYHNIGLKQSPVFYGYNELFNKNSQIMKKFVKLVVHYVTIY